MASVNEKELSRIIKSKQARGAYYLYGTDLYAVGEYKRALVKSVLDGADKTYNLHEYQGRDIDIQAVAESCEGYPVFAERLCVTVCDLDMEEETKSRPGHKRLDDAAVKTLTETVSDLPETTALIFYTADADIYGGKKYPTAKNKKLIDLVAKNGTVCEINVRSRQESVKSIISKAEKLGCGITPEAAGMIFDRCCGNMNMIMCELDKLSSYVNGGVIGEEAAGILTPDYSGAKSYSLADAAAAGNVSRTMQLYHELINDPENTPVYLLYVLTGSMNDLYRARLALDHNRSAAETAKDFGYAKNLEFRVRNAFSSARKTSAAHLRECLRILARADIDMKSGRGAPELILERAIVSMLAGRKEL